MRASLALVLALALPACLEARDPLSIPDPLPASGRTYVIDSITVGGTAREASELAVDIDGDERPDNLFGASLSVAESLLDVDLDAELAAALADGELLHLLMFAEDATGEFLDTGRLFLGADTDGDPTNNFDGSAELAIRDGAALDGAAFGEVSSIGVELGDGRLVVENVLFAPIRLPLFGARIVGEFDAVGDFHGRIAGGISEGNLARLRNEVVTAIAGEGNEQCDASQIPCCPSGSRGEIYMESFDADRDCQLTAAEVDSHDIFDWLLFTDVDLDGDGDDDAMSASFEITAVPARFAIP